MADFHVAPDGDDGADGRSPRSAWRSLARASAAQLAPGDRLLLAAERVHVGTLALTGGGAPDRPVVVGSYGDGRAIIRVADPAADGVRVRNAGGVEVRDLVIAGPGYWRSTGAGVRCLAEGTDERFAWIRIHDVEASGFAHGVSLLALPPGTSGCGFRDVRIERVRAWGNGEAGIHSSGGVESVAGYEGWPHADVAVVDCDAHDNPGVPGKTANHSGNGILLGCVERPLIERCRAWNNGGLCDATPGGPVGIWLWECTRGLIQHCVSHHNAVGSCRMDGGGFDFDGGVSDSVMQYNVSYRNAGAGYLICQYRGARPLRDCVVRCNLSVGDGQHSQNRAGVQLFSSDDPANLRGIQVLHNTLVSGTGNGGRTDGILAAGHASDVLVAGNLLVALDGGGHVQWNAEGPVAFRGNAYVSGDGRQATTLGWSPVDAAAWAAFGGDAGGASLASLWPAGLPSAFDATAWTPAAGALPSLAWAAGEPLRDLLGRAGAGAAEGVAGACQPSWR